MIRLFGKLRQMNLKSRNFLRYMQYAVGEVVLIIFGIMIALYLDDVSKDQDKKMAFETALSQIYTNLQMEKGWYQFFEASYENQSRIARLELEGKYEVPPGKEPMIVGFLNSLATGDLNLGDEAILSALHENITSPEETILVNRISSHYLVWKDWDEVINSYYIRFLNDLFEKYNSPFIENYILFRETQFGGDREYSTMEIQSAREVRSDPGYQTAIISVLNRNKDLLGRFRWKISSIQSIIDLIKKHDPEISLTFRDIGIEGSAVSSGSTGIVPMELVNPSKGIWKKRLRLKDGSIWFRDGNSALVNWAGTHALDGTLLYNGKDIPVEGGYYEIEINLTGLTYILKKVSAPSKSNATGTQTVIK